MDYFQYQDGVLRCEETDLREIAEKFGTPLYVYSRRTLLDHFNRFRDAFSKLNPTVCFSIKSCSNLAILKLLRDAGSSFDVVSGGELQRALEIGADPASIAFAGVGKTDAEIAHALNIPRTANNAASVGWFNVESEAELDNIATIAEQKGKRATIALRINPDVDPKTHEYTTTGKRETKFGIDIERAPRIFSEFSKRKSLDLAGIHLHIGSPVNTIEPYVQSVSRALKLIDTLRASGHAIRAINIGGGFGAHYDGGEAPPASAYAQQLAPLLTGKNLQVHLEPGRSIAANAGILLTKALYTKSSGQKNYIIADAAITELLRPALYGAFHFAWPIAPTSGLIPPDRRKDLKLSGTTLVDIVGPVCESGDFLAKDRWLPPVTRGDLIAIFSAGAYGMSMSSHYNSRCKPAEVLIDGATPTLIRRRETYEDLVAAERIPLQE